MRIDFTEILIVGFICLVVLALSACNTCFASKAICEANACMAKGKTAVQCETEANAAFCLANPKVCEEYRKKQ